MHFKTSFTVVIVSFMILTCQAQWHHFGANNRFTACNPTENVLNADTIPQLIRSWGIGCDDGYFSVISRSPAIADGLLFSASAGGSLRALDAKTGELKWTFGFGSTGWVPQPTVSTDGKVFYLESNSTLYTLYCINAETGSEIWRSPIQFDLGYNQTAIVTVDETSGIVYMQEVPFAPNSGKLYALKIDTGSITWYMGPATHSVAFEGDHVIADGGHVFAAVTNEGSYIEKVVQIDPVTHQVSATFERPSGITFPEVAWFTMCNSHMAILYADGENASQTLCSLVVYDLASQTSEWQFSPGRKSTGALAYDPATAVVYLATDPYLYAFDIADGQQVWQYTGYDEILSPTIANGIVYFLSDTNMYAIRQSNASLVRSYPIGYEVEPTSQVAISDGMLYFSGNGGTCDLFALGFPPQCETLGVSIEMPSNYFTPGDAFSCSVKLCNPNQPLTGVPLFVLLDVLGVYYFAPDFSAFDYYTLNVPTGFSDQVVIPEFFWPYTAGEGTGVQWLAAMTNSSMTQLSGEMDTFAFGWGYY